MRAKHKIEEGEIHQSFFNELETAIKQFMKAMIDSNAGADSY